MDHDAFDILAGSADPAMVIVTAAAGPERAGCLVGFHAQCSIHPRRYAVWLSKANHTYRVALLGEHLGVHFLTEDDRDLAELFGGETGDEVDKFTRSPAEVTAEGVPVLTRCPHRMVVRRRSMLDDGGDHVCFVTEPVAVTTAGRFRPLRMAQVRHLAPGHTVDERPRPPTERAVGG